MCCPILIEISRGSHSIDGGGRGVGEDRYSNTVFDKWSELFSEPIEFFSWRDIQLLYYVSYSRWVWCLVRICIDIICETRSLGRRVYGPTMRDIRDKLRLWMGRSNNLFRIVECERIRLRVYSNANFAGSERYITLCSRQFNIRSLWLGIRKQRNSWFDGLDSLYLHVSSMWLDSLRFQKLTEKWDIFTPMTPCVGE